MATSYSNTLGGSHSNQSAQTCSILRRKDESFEVTKPPKLLDNPAHYLSYEVFSFTLDHTGYNHRPVLSKLSPDLLLTASAPEDEDIISYSSINWSIPHKIQLDTHVVHARVSCEVLAGSLPEPYKNSTYPLIIYPRLPTIKGDCGKILYIDDKPAGFHVMQSKYCNVALPIFSESIKLLDLNQFQLQGPPDTEPNLIETITNSIGSLVSGAELMSGIFDQPSVFSNDPASISTVNSARAVIPLGFGKTDYNTDQSHLVSQDSFIDMQERMKIPSRIAILNWKTTQPAGTLLATKFVSPMLSHEDLGATNLYSTSITAAYAQFYRLWRGTLRFSIEIFNTHFHQGQLYVVFNPHPQPAAKDVTYTAVRNLKGVTIDLSTSNSTTLDIPFVYPFDYCRNANFNPKLIDLSTGAIYIFVQNTLVVSTTTVPTSIEINISLSAGEDFELRVPRPMPGAIKSVNSLSRSYFVDGKRHVVPDTFELQSDSRQGASAMLVPTMVMPSYTPTTARNVSAVGDSETISTSNIFDEDYIIGSFNIATTNTITDKLASFKIPSDYFNPELATRGISSYHAFFRSDFKIIIKVATTQFNAGCIRVLFNPHGDSLANRSFHASSQLPHCDINLNGQTEGSFVIPWANIGRVMTRASDTQIGTVEAYVWNTFQSSAGATLIDCTVWARALDPHFAVRRIAATLQGEDPPRQEEIPASAVDDTVNAEPIKDVSPSQTPYLPFDQTHTIELLKRQDFAAEIAPAPLAVGLKPTALTSLYLNEGVNHQYLESLYKFKSGTTRYNIHTQFTKTDHFLFGFIYIPVDLVHTSTPPATFKDFSSQLAVLQPVAEKSSFTLELPQYSPTPIITSRDVFGSLNLYLYSREPTSSKATPVPSIIVITRSVGEDYRLYYPLPPPILEDVPVVSSASDEYDDQDHTDLLLSGDIESNPGPTYCDPINRFYQITANWHHPPIIEDYREDNRWHTVIHIKQWRIVSHAAAASRRESFRRACSRAIPKIKDFLASLSVPSDASAFLHSLATTSRETMQEQGISDVFAFLRRGLKCSVDSVADWIVNLLEESVVRRFKDHLESAKSYLKSNAHEIIHTFTFLYNLAAHFNSSNWMGLLLNLLNESMRPGVSEKLGSYFTKLSSCIQGLILQSPVETFTKLVKLLFKIICSLLAIPVTIATSRRIATGLTTIRNFPEAFKALLGMFNKFVNEITGKVSLEDAQKIVHTARSYFYEHQSNYINEKLLKHGPNFLKFVYYPVSAHMTKFEVMQTPGFSFFFKEVRETFLRYESLLRNGISRVEPTFALLQGPAGCGKTLIAQIFTRVLATDSVKQHPREIITSDLLDTLVYTLDATGEVKHWDGYHCQPVVFIDDLLATSDYERIAPFLQMISSATFPVPKASIEEKGTQFKSDYVIATSNYNTVNQYNEIKCKPAFNRRFHNSYLVVPKGDKDAYLVNRESYSGPHFNFQRHQQLSKSMNPIEAIDEQLDFYRQPFGNETQIAPNAKLLFGEIIRETIANHTAKKDSFQDLKPTPDQALSFLAHQAPELENDSTMHVNNFSKLRDPLPGEENLCEHLPVNRFCNSEPQPAGLEYRCHCGKWYKFFFKCKCLKSFDANYLSEVLDTRSTLPNLWKYWKEIDKVIPGLVSRPVYDFLHSEDLMNNYLLKQEGVTPPRRGTGNIIVYPGLTRSHLVTGIREYLRANGRTMTIALDSATAAFTEEQLNILAVFRQFDEALFWTPAAVMPFNILEHVSYNNGILVSAPCYKEARRAQLANTVGLAAGLVISTCAVVKILSVVIKKFVGAVKSVVNLVGAISSKYKAFAATNPRQVERCLAGFKEQGWDPTQIEKFRKGELGFPSELPDFVTGSDPDCWPPAATENKDYNKWYDIFKYLSTLSKTEEWVEQYDGRRVMPRKRAFKHQFTSLWTTEEQIGSIRANIKDMWPVGHEHCKTTFLFLDSTHILANRHYTYGNYAGVTWETEIRGVRKHLMLDAPIEVNPDLDVCIFKVPQIDTIRKISHRFITREQWEKEVAGFDTYLNILTTNKHHPHDLAAVLSSTLSCKPSTFPGDYAETEYYEVELDQPTLNGDCGSPYLYKDVLVGIHCLGGGPAIDPRAGFVRITREDLEEAMTEAGEVALDSVPILTEQLADFEWDGNGNGLECLGTYAPVGIPLTQAVNCRSEKSHARMWNPELFPNSHAPAPLNRGVLYKNATKYVYLKDCMPSSAAADNFFVDVLSLTFPKGRNVTPLTDDEILNGTEGVMPIKITSSSGVWNTISKKKTAFLDTSYDIDSGVRSYAYSEDYYQKKHPVFNKSLADYILEREEAGRKAIKLPSFYVVSLKDELLPLEKVAAKKTRVFEASSLDETILVKKYFGRFTGHFRTHPGPLMMHTIGADREAVWNVLYQHLKKTSDFGMAADYSKFDSTIPPAAFQAFRKLVDKFYQEGTQEDKNMRAVLVSSLQYAYQVLEDKILQSEKGNKSGTYLTDVFNSCVNVWAWTTSFYEVFKATYDKAPTVDDWFNNITLFTHGDDLICSVKPAIDWNLVLEAIRDKGFFITSADKKAHVELQPIEELEYLKSGFRLEKGVMWPPMPESTTYRELNWCKKSCRDNHTVRKTMIQEARRFSAYHGSASLDELDEKLKQGFPAEPAFLLDPIEFVPYERMWLELWQKQHDCVNNRDVFTVSYKRWLRKFWSPTTNTSVGEPFLSSANATPTPKPL